MTVGCRQAVTVGSRRAVTMGRRLLSTVPFLRSPLLACSRRLVTARHSSSAAHRHRSSPPACSCRPVTAHHRWSAARSRRPSPPFVPSRQVLHMKFCRCKFVEENLRVKIRGQSFADEDLRRIGADFWNLLPGFSVRVGVPRRVLSHTLQSGLSQPPIPSPHT